MAGAVHRPPARRPADRADEPLRAAAEPAPPAPRRRADRDPRSGPALLRPGGRRVAAGERDRALRRGGGAASRADGGLGRGPPPGGDLACRTPGPGAIRARLLRQRAQRRGISDGGGAGAPAAGGARAPAADLDPRPGHGAPGRRDDRPLGLRAHPARPRGGKRVRHLARRRTAPGFATTVCSPTSCGSSCAAPTPPASTPCTAWQLAGTRSTGIRPRRSGTRRRHRTGHTRRACLPTATSA